MTNVPKAADARMAKDAWVMACDRQKAAMEAMDANMTEATVSEVARAQKAQQRAWAAWNRAEAA